MNTSQPKSRPGRGFARYALFLLLAAVLLGSLAWRSQQTPQPGTGTPQAGTPLAQTITITPTPRFPEYFTNKDQTNGIVLGSTVLVLIVVIGTLTVLRHSSPRRKD